MSSSQSGEVIDIPLIQHTEPGKVSRPHATTQGLFFQVAAELELFRGSVAAFGDTDRDGKHEVVFRRRDPSTFVQSHRVVEVDEGTYTVVQDGFDLVPYAISDLDGDGRSELLGQVGSNLYVLEAPDANSHPDSVIWVSPPLSNVIGYSIVGDSDRDGRLEIIHSVNSLGPTTALVIFESNGDNSFAKVCSLATPGDTAEKQISDLDGDGLLEILSVTTSGLISVLESPADDVWEVVWSCGTDLFNAGGIEAGLDTDGNGKPELFVMGQSGNFCWTTYIVESIGDNAFAAVGTLSVDCNLESGLARNALGDVDAVGCAEYIMDAPNGLWTYGSPAVGVWEVVRFYPESPTLGHGPVFAYDLDQDGGDEVIWSGTPTVVLENALVSSVPNSTPSHREVAVFPNPLGRGTATLLASHLGLDRGRLSVYDVLGRLVLRESLAACTAPIALDLSDLPGGVYLVAIETPLGQSVASGRITLVR